MAAPKSTVKPGAGTPLTEAELDELRKLDTPTICNALEILTPERRAFGFTTAPLICPFPELGSMVGYARTASIRAMAPSGRPPAEDRSVRLAYYEYVASGPGPRISVIQDLDGKRAGFGAFWGEVHSAVHKALGCAGVVTDGSVRDLHLIAPGFQMLAGAVAPSHAHVHLVGFAAQVNVAGMVVGSGDLIHADRHGAVVIPHGVARHVAAAAALCAKRETVILNACRAKGFTLERLKQAIAASDEIH